MSWPLRVSGIINSSPKLREQGIDSYGNGVFSGIGSDANNLKSTMNYNSGANEIVNGTVGSIESFSGIGSGLALLKAKSHVVTSMGSPKTVSIMGSPKTVSINSLPVGMGSGINSSFLDRYLFGLPIYVLIIIAVIIAIIVLWMVLK